MCENRANNGRRRNNRRYSILKIMRFRRIPLYKLMPNFVTIVGLCLGISALRYALDEKFKIATGLILIATIMDCIDGRLARLLKCESDFGAQLDSLADIVSFGVAPALVSYLWILNDIPYLGVGWSIALFYITCSALRLARFNSELSNPESIQKAKMFFTGVPAPVAASLSLIPMITTFELKHIAYSTSFVGTYIIIIGILMISRLPTFSLKKIIIPEGMITIIQIVFCIFITVIILEPWWVLPILGILYFLSIPISAYKYYTLYHKKLYTPK